jgi:hypothetical protein
MVCFHQHVNRRAGDGNRTHTTSLEGWSSTIELHPQSHRKTPLKSRNPQQQNPASDTNKKLVTSKNHGGSRIRTCEGRATRFTVWPLWPLGYPAEMPGNRRSHLISKKPTENPQSDRTTELPKPAVGFEPTTSGLQNRYSAVELRWRRSRGLDREGEMIAIVLRLASASSQKWFRCKAVFVSATSLLAKQQIRIFAPPPPRWRNWQTR